MMRKSSRGSTADIRRVALVPGQLILVVIAMSIMMLYPISTVTVSAEASTTPDPRQVVGTVVSGKGPHKKDIVTVQQQPRLSTRQEKLGRREKLARAEKKQQQEQQQQEEDQENGDSGFTLANIDNSKNKILTAVTPKKSPFKNLTGLYEEEVPRNFTPVFINNNERLSNFENHFSYEQLALKNEHLPLCRANQHTTGIWVRIPDHILINKKKPYYCCDHSYHPEDNPKECGKWQQIYSSGSSSNSSSRTVYDDDNAVPFGAAHSCACDSKERSTHSLSDREKYRWFPQSCQLLEWNATAFCELLGDRNVMFIGDSTASQMAYSLRAQIYWDNKVENPALSSYSSPSAPTSANTTAHSTSSSGKCSSSTSKISSLIANAMITEADINVLISYIKSVTKPTIIVLNNGPHLLRTQGLYKFFEGIEALVFNNTAVIDSVRAKLVSVVWRTIHPGHYNCESRSGHHHSDAGGPIDPFNETLYKQSNPFRYSLFPYWDFLSVNKAKKMNFSILDMSPLYYRADAHPAILKDRHVLKDGTFQVDCLHNCLPGPMDMSVHLLHQMLYNEEIVPLSGNNR